MEKLIIDTDPGVDDAQAILMAAAHADADIVALTAVGGNVGLAHTARNALTLVELIGAEIPVYAGCDGPLVAFQADAAVVHGDDGLGDVGFQPLYRTVEAEHGALALVRLANAAPNAYTLVALGPLTNVAVALKLDPLLPRKLKRFVIMGGAVTGRGNTANITAEFNIYHDPEAAFVVFEGWARAGVQFELVDWEATVRHQIPNDVMRRWLAGEGRKATFGRRITAKTMAFVTEHFGRDAFYAADPLAMAVALEPAIVRDAATHYVTVEMTGGLTRGQTIVDWRGRLHRQPNARIISQVDTTRFFAMLEAAFKES